MRLVNLSTSHRLYLRRWPYMQREPLDMAYLGQGNEIWPAETGIATLTQGKWWICTREDGTGTPGWLFVDVRGRGRGARRDTAPRARVDAEGRTKTNGEVRRPKPELKAEHLSFLVDVFVEYLAIPPKVVPRQQTISDVDPDRGNSYRETILNHVYGRDARKRGALNSEILERVFQGDGAVTFQQVERILDR